MALLAVPGAARAQALLAQIERVSREAASRSAEPDCDALVILLDDALDSLADRRAFLAYIALFLSRCVTGSIPSHRDWLPPI